MNSKEKYLYHQIHPLKLVTDIGAAGASLCLLWRHQLAFALVVMLAPPLLISFLLMRYADLEPYRQSAFGKYVARSMSHAMEVVRLAGMAVTALGAWHQSLWIIAAGTAIVLFGWLRGKSAMPEQVRIKVSGRVGVSPAGFGILPRQSFQRS